MLHKQAGEDYKTKRLEHKEMHMELNQHQERSRDTSGGRSAHTEVVHQYLDRDELRTRLMEQFADIPGSRAGTQTSVSHRVQPPVVCRATGHQRR